MAYENYRFVSWSNGTPITGDRMAQLSTNIEQVKLATDDRPQGVIKYSKLTALQSYAAGNVAENTLVNLRDDTPSGSDNRVSADSDRYVRLMVTFPGIKITARGAEDTRYELTIKQGLDTDPSPVTLAKFYLNPHLYAFYDVATNGASTETIDVRSSGNDVYFGAGSYSTVIDSSTGLTNVNFFVSVKRVANSDMANSPGYTVMSSSTSPLEFYAEDIGGTS
jgi:hypothetical protein